MNRLLNIIKEEMGIDEISPDTDLISIGADSIDIIRIVFQVEKEFKVQIPRIDHKQFETPNDIWTYLQSLLLLQH